jgi:hypothetical protein
VDSIVYGNMRIELLAQHGARIQRITPDARPPLIRSRPWPSMARVTDELGGRDSEVAAARAVATGAPVGFYADCGFGKTTLLWHLAARPDTGNAVYLRVAGQGLDDVLQELLAKLYASDQPFKPTPEQRAQLLGRVRALVLLDDVTFGPGELGDLLEALPDCSVVVASKQPVLGRLGRSVHLAGLADDAALDLLADGLGRDLTDAERADALRLCGIVDGHPLHLRQAAALVRVGRHSFADLVRLARADVAALDRLSVDELAEPERRALAVLALAAGVVLPAEIIGTLADLTDAGEALRSLRRRGLIEQHGDRFGLPVCRAADNQELLLRHLQLGEAIRRLVDTIERQAWTGDQAVSAAQAALVIVRYAAERGQWPAVVRLVDAVEPVLAVAGRWEAWRQALEWGLEAGRVVGDAGAEAKFSHQLGTLEFALDHLERARSLWQRALGLREELGDQAGAAVTRANLALLEPVPVTPSRSRRRRGLRIKLWPEDVWPWKPPRFRLPRRRRTAGMPHDHDHEDAPSPQPVAEERVSFTVAYPGLVSPGVWHSLSVFMHLDRLQDVVGDLIAQRSRQLATSRATAFSAFQRGTLLRLAPRARGLLFNPSSVEATWFEDIHELPFHFQAAADVAGQVVLGAVEVYAGPLLVAQVPLSIRVHGAVKDDQDAAEPTTATAELFRTIFASYAHEDSDIVQACAEVYTALGIEVLIDKASLRSGQHWQAALRTLVEQADLFQLYWSAPSSMSKYVAEEWRQALSLQDRKGEQFIRPLYWKDPWPAPPPELSHIHFAPLDLSTLAKVAPRRGK